MKFLRQGIKRRALNEIHIYSQLVKMKKKITEHYNKTIFKIKYTCGTIGKF